MEQALLEKLIVTQIVIKFHTLYGIPRLSAFLSPKPDGSTQHSHILYLQGTL
jgi:hypothetical protein